MWPNKSVRRSQRSSGAPVHQVIVEPGTSTLRLLVVQVADGQATVLGWAEGPGWDPEKTDAQSLLTVCERTLVRAEEMARAPGERWILPDQILVGLPASRLRGQAWPIEHRRSRPDRPVDEEELETLLLRALRLAVNRLCGDREEGSGWLLVDAAPVALDVDGRGVTDPVGFRGQEIGAMVFASLVRVEVLETWRLVARELEFSTLTLAAAPLALAAGLPVPQGILVDIGGRTTDLIWCRGGRPVMLDSLPIGGAELTHSLVQKWRLPGDRAERLKHGYADGILVPEARAQVREVLWPTLQSWYEQMEAVLARMNQDQPLPQHLVLLGGGSALPEMAEAVRSLAWSQRLHFARYPQVSRLGPTRVPGVVNRTNLGRGMGDVPALALAGWAARQNQPPGRPERVLSELVQA